MDTEILITSDFDVSHILFFKSFQQFKSEK